MQNDTEDDELLNSLGGCTGAELIVNKTMVIIKMRLAPNLSVIQSASGITAASAKV